MKFALCIALAGSIALLVNEAQSDEAIHKHIDLNETVIFNSFNQSDNTYNGYIQINASPCPTANYNMGLQVSGVKNAEDAKNKLANQIRQISADVDKAAENCGKH